MDKQTTDKAWGAMRELLDREMPEKRRHRIGWWWFGLLLLPIAGFGSWYWLHLTDTPSLKQETAPTFPLANFSTAADQANASTSEQQVQNSTSENTPANNLDRSRVRKSAGSAVIPASPAAKPLLVEYKPTLTTIENLQNDPSSQVPISNSEWLSHMVLSLEMLPIASQLIEIQHLQPIASHPRAIANTIKPVGKSGNNHWAFGASTALSTEQFNKINGFSTGLTVDWQFSRKWGLRTGMWYNIHIPQEKYRPVASVASVDYQSNVYGGVILVDVYTGHEIANGNGTDSLSGNVLIPINRLQRLEIPLQLYWQAARPLKIIGGLSITRTLSTKADRQNYSGDYILKLADQRAADGASKLSFRELDNWSADAMLGAGVRLGRSFELGLSAKMPLNKFPGEVKTNQVGTIAGLGNHSLGSTRKQNGPVFSIFGTLFF